MNRPFYTRSRALWCAIGAAVLLIVAGRLPLWQMRMEAPQYRDEEALKVKVYPDAMRGDLNEITVLNQYIGVHIPKNLPQLKWLPGALLAAAGLGLGAAFLRGKQRRNGLTAVPVMLAMALLAAAAQAQWQMYQIGHRRDAKTTLRGFKDFTAPLLGEKKIAQFEVTSSFGLGAYLIGVAIALQLAGAWFSREGSTPGGTGASTTGRVPAEWDLHPQIANNHPPLHVQ